MLHPHGLLRFVGVFHVGLQGHNAVFIRVADVQVPVGKKDSKSYTTGVGSGVAVGVGVGVGVAVGGVVGVAVGARPVPGSM